MHYPEERGWISCDFIFDGPCEGGHGFFVMAGKPRKKKWIGSDSSN
jgi:hypothetical protein